MAAWQLDAPVNGGAPNARLRDCAIARWRVRDCALAIARLRDRALPAAVGAQRSDVGDAKIVVGALERRARGGELLLCVGGGPRGCQPGLCEQPLALLIGRVL